jgi:hypothetical protein
VTKETPKTPALIIIERMQTGNKNEGRNTFRVGGAILPSFKGVAGEKEKKKKEK